MRERIAVNDVPKPFQGSSIGMITAGLMALAFLGFSGLVKDLRGRSFMSLILVAVTTLLVMASASARYSALPRSVSRSRATRWWTR